MGGHSSGGLFPGTLGSSGDILDADFGRGTISDTVGKKEGRSPDPKNTREQLLSEATTSEAKRIISELYRPGAEVGDGGTADAIREQLRAGVMVGGKDHARKGRERMRQIENILKRNPDHPDRELLKKLRDDLNNALGGA